VRERGSVPERLPGRVFESVVEGLFETFVEKPYEGLFSRSRSRNHLFSGKKVDSGSLSGEKYRVRLGEKIEMEWVGGIAFRRLRFKILPPCRESSRRFFAGFGVSCWRVKKKWFWPARKILIRQN